MWLVVITALGVGGATVIGAALGFLIGKIPHKWSDGMMSFAAGVMLAAAVIGLIMPAVEMTGKARLWEVALGILAGAVFLNLMDQFTPHLHRISGVDIEKHRSNDSMSRVMLFVIAIAIHNLPEGMAAGVGFGTDNISGAISVSIGIALHNIPEGLILISPLVLAGVSRMRALGIAAFTGLFEVIGTFIGYFAASAAGVILPFTLAFAGGAMLYIVSDEMIPETHSHGHERLATYSLLIGFILMLAIDTVI
ncbi:MAG: ZIP family metal transporter [Christensenellales bacterium]|jgi:ZIP family zinc transporter